eukprot:TRINITY_DN54257_c0_g1_i1.p1 TRINITY_DN54257_c0_g1~~TRINITY_DN54257_c0_g1_i1.p1  ORF type:complete len:256 (-),score=24.41 TRINITY_DN54257_c0_g1_i1:16-783(-)
MARSPASPKYGVSFDSVLDTLHYSLDAIGQHPQRNGVATALTSAMHDVQHLRDSGLDTDTKEGNYKMMKRAVVALRDVAEHSQLQRGQEATAQELLQTYAQEVHRLEELLAQQARQHHMALSELQRENQRLQEQLQAKERALVLTLNDADQLRHSVSQLSTPQRQSSPSNAINSPFVTPQKATPNTSLYGTSIAHSTPLSPRIASPRRARSNDVEYYQATSVVSHRPVLSDECSFCPWPGAPAEFQSSFSPRRFA